MERMERLYPGPVTPALADENNADRAALTADGWEWVSVERAGDGLRVVYERKEAPPPPARDDDGAGALTG